MLPIVLMLVFGFLFFTQAVRTQVVLDVAAREAARDYAKTHSTGRAIDKAREELSIGGIDYHKVDIDVDSTGYERRVRVELPYPIYVPFIGEYDLRLKGSASFHRESTPKYW